LETELAKVRGAESSLRLEFDRQLAEEKRILSAKYDSEVNELRTTLGSEIESRGTQIDELETLRKLDSERHDMEIGVWHARDRRVQSGLLGLEEALRGMFPFLLLNSCSVAPPPHSLIAPTGAFPDSNKAATAALEEYRAEQEIVPSSDPKAELSLGELVALAKGRLHPVTKLGGDLHEAIVSVFKTLWPGRAVPGEIQALLQWIPLAPNRLDVWKESVARAGTEQALEFVLSWYPGVNLDQLENLCEGGLAGLDKVKLRQRACAVTECAETDVSSTLGIVTNPWMAWTLRSPAPQKNLKKPPRISLITPFLRPPVAMTSSWHLELATLLRWSRLAHRAPPDRVGASLFAFMYVKLMSCPTTFRSYVPMTFHPKFLTYWFLVVYEQDLT
jgi:hypothetical protein